MKNFTYCPHCRKELKRNNIDGVDRLYCYDCGWINYLNPVPAVACIVKKENKVLLVKRGVEPQKGRWSLPAGFMELKESPEEAALRELKEETGIEGRVKGLIGVYSQPSHNYTTVLTVGYLVDKTGGRISAGDDVTAAQFKVLESPDELPFESHRQMVIDSDEQF